ncbi:type VII secretion protein EsaA [Terribacillus saccharophilus]|uniref:type VII secretion protein EsaA n=1 Tax=Terribacillus saccharophilus TaxID=361277 RepID=UPI0039828F52
MKKFDKRWILFLVLIVLLASGLSYLTLHQETTKTAEQPKTELMSIALVNEDDGATFNGNDLSFGDAFVNSVDDNDSNDWFVVSRGVAENGLKNNTYDMMIVIPNDFSEKSLNITSEAPEQVLLDYKINASENPQLKEQAEKTASNVLNDFNRRIIDVYFASIIGNLQNAQDSIGQMVNRQAVYTNSYTSNVYQPLSGYTDQFGAVREGTETSKDSFSSFEDLLNSYEEQLVEETQGGQNFVTELDRLMQLKEGNAENLANFQEQMNSYGENLTAADVEQQLEQLSATNEAINQQFAAQQENTAQSIMREPAVARNTPGTLNTATIYSGSVNLEQQIETAAERVAAIQEDIDNYLSESDEAFRAKVRDRIRATIGEGTADESNVDIINMLMDNPNRAAMNKINDAIRELPSTDLEDFENLGLDNDTKNEIVNVINTTKAYKNALNQNAGNNSNSSVPLKDVFDRLDDSLVTDGLQVSDTVKIPENKKDGQIFRLQYPEGFTPTYVGIKLPNEEEKDYTSPVLSNGEVKLPPNKAGEFSVNLILKKERGAAFDVFKPVEWSWSLEQKDIDDVDKPDDLAFAPTSGNVLASLNIVNDGDKQPSDEKQDDELTSEDDTEAPNPDQDQEADKEDSVPGEGKEQGEDKADNPSSQPGNEPGNDDTDKGNEEKPDLPGDEDKPENDDGNSDDKEEPGQEKPEEDEEKPEEPEKLYIKDNMIEHTISTPAADLGGTTELLVQAAADSLSDYNKLGALYENYFGFGMGEDFPADLNGNNILSYAKEDSLYHLFNQKDVKEVLVTYMTDQMAGSAAEQLQAPAENFRSQVAAYQEQLQQLMANADTLTDRVAATNEQAAVLNDSVSETIDNVTAWRDGMVALLEGQTEIQTNAQGEQQAVLTLGDEFQPLLMSSQSLAEQASSNMNTADQVYDTFDRINTQASTIEESGTNLVSDAEQLASDLTDKLSDDQSFTQNFTEVLQNSRVGDRQNENLYEFLSNPVQTSNEGTITAQSETVFTPYYLVLISFIVVLFTAYVISTLHMKRRQDDQFASEDSLMTANAPITIITAGLGLLEGIVIGIVSSYYLPIDNLNKLLLTAVMALLIAGMLLVATYLLRQAKMIGMFILLAVFGVYLFFTDAIGSASTAFPTIERFSPLQYMETFMMNIVEGSVNYTVAIFILVIAALAGALLNLLVINRADKGVDEADDQTETG